MPRPPAVRAEARKRVLRPYRQPEPRPVILRLGEQVGRWPRTSSCGKMSLAQLLIGPDPHDRRRRCRQPRSAALPDVPDPCRCLPMTPTAQASGSASTDDSCWHPCGRIAGVAKTASRKAQDQVRSGPGPGGGLSRGGLRSGRPSPAPWTLRRRSPRSVLACRGPLSAVRAGRCAGCGPGSSGWNRRAPGRHRTAGRATGHHPLGRRRPPRRTPPRRRGGPRRAVRGQRPVVDLGRRRRGTRPVPTHDAGTTARPWPPTPPACR